MICCEAAGVAACSRWSAEKLAHIAVNPPKRKEAEMPVSLLPSHWETERLVVHDSGLDEASDLQRTVDAIPEIRGSTEPGAIGDPDIPVLSWLTEPPLPPNGSKELFRMQSVRLGGTGELIGLLKVYHGFPADDVFWVHTLALAPRFQGQGYGPELIRGLSDEVGRMGTYTRMQLYAYLKNWRALRFWTRAGFDRVVEIRGDKVYSADADAYILLEKRLSGESAQ
jgi:ribosomal protein S18 acetylase RimI-like enzyme